MPDTPDIFDQIASQAAEPLAEPPSAADTDALDEALAEPSQAARTPAQQRAALQYLLANGWVEGGHKPRLYQHIAAHLSALDSLLEPLDLRVQLDDVRGFAFLAVRSDYESDANDESEAGEWTHPLMRRQRLTLEQSLLLAILRREFLQREQESGMGVTVRLSVDSLLPQLETYLGSTGSDMQERKRLLQLLENLRGHGLVSEVDAQDSISIRPMIVHLLNPENLQALLARLRTVAEGLPPAQEGEA